MSHRSFGIWVRLLGLGGCSSTEPSLRFEVSQLSGSWSLQITDTAGCAGSASTPTPITFRIVPRRDRDVDPADIIVGFSADSTSSWTNGTLSGYVTGSIYFSGDVSLAFATGAYDFFTQGSVPYLWLKGTIGADLVLRGVLYDPGPAGPGRVAHPPQLAPQPCAYRARATH